MATLTDNSIRFLLEETNDAFSQARGSINADYADFATLALADFKAVLQEPHLTSEDLVRRLRAGMVKSRIRCVDDEDGSCWSKAMSYYMSQTANKNTKQ